jgi:hypothetical protein
LQPLQSQKQLRSAHFRAVQVALHGRGHFVTEPATAITGFRVGRRALGSEKLGDRQRQEPFRQLPNNIINHGSTVGCLVFTVKAELDFEDKNDAERCVAALSNTVFTRCAATHYSIDEKKGHHN